MSDRIFGVFGVLLAIGYAMSALAIEESFLSDAVGPKAFPLIIAAILGISSAVIAIKPDPEPHWPDIGRFVEIAAAVVVMVRVAFTPCAPPRPGCLLAPRGHSWGMLLLFRWTNSVAAMATAG